MEFRAKNTFIQVGLAGFVLGAIFATLILRFFSPQNLSIRVLRQSDIASSSGYSFTDPLLSVTLGGSDSPEYQALEQRVQSYLSSQAQTTLSASSVRFGDIESAEGFTINPSQTYDPASLTKVPLAMAYYQLAQSDPGILSQHIAYTGDSDLDADEQIRSPQQLKEGESYSVEEMIEHMLKYSDNNAEQLLADHLKATGQLNALQTLFTDLGIKIKPNNPDYMTVQSYSLFLRVLFNSTYLDREYSEKLLQLLSEGDFKNGISAGVPGSVIVSQKFGDARIPDQTGAIVGAELQNCGIVYYPDHPYVLCVMTKGDNVSDLERVIAGVSQIVYAFMQSKYQP